MRKRNIVILITMILVLILGTSTFIEAYGGMHKMMGYGRSGRGMMGFRQFHLQQSQVNPLQLSEEQSKLYAELRENYLQERYEIEKELQSNYFELKEAVYSGITDDNLKSMQNKIDKLGQSLISLRIDFWQKTKEIMTPEQLEKLKQNIEEVPEGPGKFGSGICPFYPQNY